MIFKHGMRTLYFLHFFILTGLSGFAPTLYAFDFKITVKSAQAVGPFALGVGSSIQVDFPNQDKIDGIFLGDLIEPKGTIPQRMFLSSRENKIFMIPKKDTQMSANLASPANQAQMVLNPYPQVGGTCGAYAMFHFFLQNLISGAVYSPSLAHQVQSEEGRTDLLVNFVSRYYLERPGISTLHSVMNALGKPHGIKCTQSKYETNDQAIAFIQSQLSTGQPVMVAFDIGQKMLTSSYDIHQFDRRGKEDPRLWIPRKVGQRNGGGHVIVLAAAFRSKGRLKSVVIDSDWEDPRIWDVAKYLGSKTDMKKIEFHSCKSLK